MLSSEWRELEVLCDRLSELRHRSAAAHRSKHAGLIDGIKAEIGKLRRQREQLVRHIAVRLGAAAGGRSHPSDTAEQRLPERHGHDALH
jgi:hypothetical protein